MSNNADYVNEQVRYISHNEGRKKKAYLDGEGVPTIGTGFNLTRPDARKLIERMGLNFQDVLDKKVSLSQAQITKLFRNTHSEAFINASDVFGHAFQDMGDARRTVIVDLLFTLGVTRFRRFPRMIRAMEKGDRETASWELLRSAKDPSKLSRYALQVKGRALQNAYGLWTGRLMWKPGAKVPGTCQRQWDTLRD